MNHQEPDTIAGLLTRARGGDRQALDRLFAACRSYLGIVAQAQLASWLQPKADASDLVQQALLEAYKGFETFHGQTGGEWLGWLRRILSNNAVDFARRYQGTGKEPRGRETPLESWQPADQHETPSKNLVAKERELRLAEALSHLSPDRFRDGGAGRESATPCLCAGRPGADGRDGGYPGETGPGPEPVLRESAVALRSDLPSVQTSARDAQE